MSFNNVGFLTAPVFIATLSAPDFKILDASSSVLIPPPTVMGTKIFFVAFYLG